VSLIDTFGRWGPLKLTILLLCTTDCPGELAHIKTFLLGSWCKMRCTRKWALYRVCHPSRMRSRTRVNPEGEKHSKATHD